MGVIIMAYATTSVPVEKSKEAIRQLLINSGARGIQFSEDFQDHLINIKFAKQISDNLRTVSISLKVLELPKPKRPRTHGTWRRGHYTPPKSDRDRFSQMERATYRALHWWLKSQFEAVEFGLLSFENVFLSHFEWMIDGKQTTVGALVLPHLSNGSNFLPAPKDDDFIEADYRAS